jgi:hypothetical protein
MVSRSSWLLAAGALAVALGACGGGSSGNNGSAPPPTTTQNPCSTVSLEAETTGAPVDVTLAELKRSHPEGNPRWRVLDDLWTHREAQLRPARIETLTPQPNAVDVGDVAVVPDQGDILLPANPYDLKSLGLRFSRNSSQGYDVTRIDGNFRSPLGTRLALSDDDSQQAPLQFAFQFYGTAQTLAFVNSDGNITFGEADKASTERNVARLLTGPPRVAPFLADLDPSAGGSVWVNAGSSQYTVTWCAVRGFDVQNTTTAQATVFADGTIEMKYGATITLPEAVVGISPGHTADFKPVNLSDVGPTAGGSGAVGERFSQTRQLDAIALGNRFYASHPDNYDQLVVWADAPVIRDAFAYETTVANEIRGIGVDLYDLSHDFGSAGRLRSMVQMDDLHKYPDDPQEKFFDENNTLSLIGQEVGHRWLAFLEFRDFQRQRSQALLGRDLAHWSFFLDSDASVMEGNDIEDLGGGSFRTVAAVQRYSALDQYAMGLIPASAVPRFFYVDGPVNTQPRVQRESAPQVGVTFSGTRRDVLIDDVIAIEGDRSPSAADAPKVHRQAFLYLVTLGGSGDSAGINKIDQIRRQWETFFLQATNGRMRAITALK